MAKVVFSQQRVDPESIFPLESICNIDEGKNIVIIILKKL